MWNSAYLRCLINSNLIIMLGMSCRPHSKIKMTLLNKKWNEVLKLILISSIHCGNFLIWVVSALSLIQLSNLWRIFTTRVSMLVCIQVHPIYEGYQLPEFLCRFVSSYVQPIKDINYLSFCVGLYPGISSLWRMKSEKDLKRPEPRQPGTNGVL